MSNFYTDRNQRGWVAEDLIVELCHIRGIPVEVNPAPEEDLAGRSAWDICINAIPCDVKADWMSAHTGNICIEAKSLQHTRSEYFLYVLPRPSGVYIHVFAVKDLIELYNKRQKVNRGDGTYAEQYSFPHKIVGDQPDNMSVILPQKITESVGEPLWKFAKELTKIV